METKEVIHFESLYPEASRQKELERVIGYIKLGQSVQVVGLPGVGQSTFLKLLSFNKKIRIKHLGASYEKYHFVLINFSEVRSRPFIEAIKIMFLSLADSLRDRGFNDLYDQIFNLFKESAKLQDEMVMITGMRRALDILALDNGITTVFLLDRFEAYIPDLTNDFFSILRTFRDRNKHKFSVIISLNRPLWESVESVLLEDYSEYLKENIVYLALKDEAILNFRINNLEVLYEQTIDTGIKNRIFELAGSFGKLSKNCAQYVLSNHISREISTEKLVEMLLSDSSVQKPLMDIWHSLAPSEQDFLLSNTDYSKADADYKYLSEIGILKDGKITIPLFEIYLNSSISKLEKKTESTPIEFNANTNEIRKGTDLISDRLTRSEFKLLRFLIEKQDSVIDRESIINSVWSDSASVAGVTDQALDQLFLRLRRKIEDDPINPVHIQTVKGRGVRFRP